MKTAISKNKKGMFINQKGEMESPTTIFIPKEKCRHEWYGRRYCHKCGQIEYWGRITGNTVKDFENKVITGIDNSKPMVVIPKEKISGLRYGQLIVGAIDKLIDHRELLHAETLVDKLFVIENSDLQKAIDEFLKEYETKIKL